MAEILAHRARRPLRRHGHGVRSRLLLCAHRRAGSSRGAGFSRDVRPDVALAAVAHVEIRPCRQPVCRARFWSGMVLPGRYRDRGGRNERCRHACWAVLTGTQFGHCCLLRLGHGRRACMLFPDVQSTTARNRGPFGVGRPLRWPRASPPAWRGAGMPAHTGRRRRCSASLRHAAFGRRQ